MRDITTSAEFDKVSGTVVLVFHANWCGPCKHYKPIYSRVNIDGVTVLRSDVDMSPELSSRFSVKSVPTTVIIKNGVVASQFSGTTTYENLVSKI